MSANKGTSNTKDSGKQPNKDSRQIQHAPIVAVPTPLKRPTLNVTHMRKFGWRRAHIDFINDDFHPSLTVEKAAALPNTADLRPGMPPVYDQGKLGSCVGNGSAGAIEYDRMRQGCCPCTPSRLMIYYGGRVINGSVSEDSGITIHEGVQALMQQGVCPESEWPYVESQFAVKPPVQCYTDALKCKVVVIRWVEQMQHDICGILSGSGLPGGLPVLVGIQAYDSIMTPEVAQTGAVPMPQKGETCLGGHCVLLVGYNATNQVFIFRNSWGSDWGMKGYGTIPFAYILNPKLAAELGTISSVTPAS